MSNAHFDTSQQNDQSQTLNRFCSSSSSFCTFCWLFLLVSPSWPSSSSTLRPKIKQVTKSNLSSGFLIYSFFVFTWYSCHWSISTQQYIANLMFGTPCFIYCVFRWHCACYWKHRISKWQSSDSKRIKRKPFIKRRTFVFSTFVKVLLFFLFEMLSSDFKLIFPYVLIWYIYSHRIFKVTSSHCQHSIFI